MILSRKGQARFAGMVLVQAIAAGQAVAGPQDAAPLGVTGFGLAAPVDSAVLRGATAWAEGETLVPDWSWRPAALADLFRAAPGRQGEGESGSPGENGSGPYTPSHAELPAGLGAIAGSAQVLRYARGDSMRLLVQWHEHTTLREAGGISHATTNVSIDVGLDGLIGAGGVR